MKISKTLALLLIGALGCSTSQKSMLGRGSDRELASETCGGPGSVDPKSFVGKYVATRCESTITTADPTSNQAYVGTKLSIKFDLNGALHITDGEDSEYIEGTIKYINEGPQLQNVSNAEAGTSKSGQSVACTTPTGLYEVYHFNMKGPTPASVSGSEVKYEDHWIVESEGDGIIYTVEHVTRSADPDQDSNRYLKCHYRKL